MPNRTATNDGYEPVSSSAPGAGTILSDRWELIAMLGAGGMGEVWRARHVELGRQVAVKMLAVPSVANRARLAREARILAGVHHPAVIQVFDVGEHAGVPYFVMEWLDADSLAQVIERSGPMLPERAVPLFLPLLEGLAIAHRAGFLHRDLKPDNVLVATTEDGTQRLVLIDFGIATAPGAVEGRLTRTGALVGTPEYMAPEVLRGRDADLRADVWGMCVTLFEAIVGVSPFRRSDFVATVRAVVDDAPADWPQGVDAELRAILGRGLAKNEAQRFASLAQLHAELTRWWASARAAHARTEPPFHAQPPTPRPVPSVRQPPHHPPTLQAAPGPEEAAPVSLDALIRSRFGQES